MEEGKRVRVRERKLGGCLVGKSCRVHELIRGASEKESPILP